MKLPFLSKIFKSQQEGQYLAIDLGTDLVKVAVFRPPTELESSPQILGTSRQPHGLTAMRGNEIVDLDAVLETIDMALEEVNLRAGSLPKDVVLGLSGNTIHNVGVTVRVNRAKPEIEITEKEFELLCKKIEGETLQKATEMIGRTTSHFSDLTHIGTYFTGYMVDGAQVDTPLGLGGASLQTEVLHSFIREHQLQQINTLADQLHLKIVALFGTTISLTSHILEKFPAGIVVDFGGQVTEVVVFNARKIIGNTSFNLGSRHFTQAIAASTGGSFDEAERLKINFVEDSLDVARAMTVKSALNDPLSWWVKGLEAALKQFNLNNLPAHIFVAGESAHMPELKSSLTAFPWTHNLPFSEFPKIEVLGGGDIILKALAETQT